MRILKINKTVILRGKHYKLYPYMITSDKENGGYIIIGKEIKPLGIFKLGIETSKNPIYFFKPLKEIFLKATLRLLKDFDADYVDIWWKVKTPPVSTTIKKINAEMFINYKHRLYTPLQEVKTNS